MDLTASAANFRIETQDTFLITGFNETEFMERLHLKVEPFFEDLKKEFQEPLPDDETEGSKQRRVVVERALDKLEGALVEVYRQYGVPDTDVRDKFARIRPHILHVVLVTGGSRHIMPITPLIHCAIREPRRQSPTAHRDTVDHGRPFYHS